MPSERILNKLYEIAQNDCTEKIEYNKFTKDLLTSINASEEECNEILKSILDKTKATSQPFGEYNNGIFVIYTAVVKEAKEKVGKSRQNNEKKEEEKNREPITTENNLSKLIEESIKNYSSLSMEEKLDLAYSIKDMSDTQFEEYLKTTDEERKKDVAAGILTEEESIAIKDEELAERVSQTEGLKFDAVMDLLDRKREGTITENENIIFSVLCKNNPILAKYMYNIEDEREYYYNEYDIERMYTQWHENHQKKKVKLSRETDSEEKDKRVLKMTPKGKLPSKITPTYKKLGREGYDGHLNKKESHLIRKEWFKLISEGQNEYNKNKYIKMIDFLGIDRDVFEKLPMEKKSALVISATRISRKNSPTIENEKVVPTNIYRPQGETIAIRSDDKTEIDEESILDDLGELLDDKSESLITDSEFSIATFDTREIGKTISEEPRNVETFLEEEPEMGEEGFLPSSITIEKINSDAVTPNQRKEEMKTARLPIESVISFARNNTKADKARLCFSKIKGMKEFAHAGIDNKSTEIGDIA